MATIIQPDVELYYFWSRLINAPHGSSKRMEAQKQMVGALSYRIHVDHSVTRVGELLLGTTKASEVLHTLNPAGEYDWHCVHQLASAFQTHCGSLHEYGLRHFVAIANLCKAGITEEQMAEASAQACPSIPSAVRSYLENPDGAY